MHELSIAMSIVELAEEESRQHGVGVRAVHLKLGPLAGVDKRALLSAYEMACERTVLEGSQLIIEDVAIEAYCSRCEAPRTIPSIQWFVCPACGSPVPEVLHGKELEVTALEIEAREVQA